MNAPFSFGPNYPSIAAQEFRLRTVLSELAANPGSHLSGLRPPEGRPEEVTPIGQALGIRDAGVALAATGQAALGIAVTIARARGPRIGVDMHRFPGLGWWLRQAGMTAVPLSSDTHGVRAEAVESAVRDGALSAIYLMPTVHNPFASIMPAARRTEIVDVARAHDVLIIEDDAYGFLGEDATAIQSLAPERTVRIIALSKLIAYTLRIGVVAFPTASQDLVRETLYQSGGSAAPLLALAAANCALAGDFTQLASQKRVEGTRRRQRCLEVLGFSGDPHVARSAWHFMVATPHQQPGTVFAKEAAAHGVILAAAQGYALDGTDAPAVRISLGAEPDVARFEAGLERLASLFEGRVNGWSPFS